MFTDADFTSVVQMHIDTVFRIALNYTKIPADAEDITQDVFEKLLKEKKPFQSDEHLRSWLIRVTVNECKKWFRSPLRRTMSFDEYASWLPATEPQKDVLKAVMALPRKYRLPIYLHYYEGYSAQEIADILKIPKGTVCTNLDRGRKMLKLELLEDEEYV